MLRINGRPMYSEIKHIYCNTEIRPTRRKINVQLNETQNTIEKPNTYEHTKIPNYE